MTTSHLFGKLFPVCNKNESIENALSSFGGWLVSSSESREFLSDENIQEIDNLIRVIVKANNYFLTGQISECYKTIYDIIFSSTYSHKIFHSKKLESNNIYFRMRQSDDEYLFSKEELFHIPFHQRHKTSNQRYSLTGYPCLYLGRSVYVCWEELNRPKFDNANIVGLKNVRPINLLDLRLPTEIKTAIDMYRLPLIIASSVEVQYPNLPFKSEYVISQAILHALIANNNTNYSTDNLNGIIYYSSKANNPQRFFDSLDLFENLIVPTVNNTKDPNAEQIFQEGFCPVLCNTFEITKPISFNAHKFFKDSKKFHSYNDCNNEDHKSYSRTEMAVLENEIKNSKTYKITPSKFFRLHPDLLENY